MRPCGRFIIGEFRQLDLISDETTFSRADSDQIAVLANFEFRSSFYSLARLTKRNLPSAFADSFRRYWKPARSPRHECCFLANSGKPPTACFRSPLQP